MVMRGIDIDAAVRVLRAGGLVAMPTETVYGLGADASSPIAIAKIFAAKGRPSQHPLIVHVADASQLAHWADAPPAMAFALAQAFWPGPLTMILHRSSHLPPEVAGGANTVGLRVPRHPLALQLLRAFGGPIAAPSANRFGAVSPTTADHVQADLGDAVDYILDGGPCTVGVESTIVDLSGPRPTLLRPGGITREQLERVLAAPLAERTEASPAAPGTLASHYAPRAHVVSLAADASDEAVMRAVADHSVGGRIVGIIAPASRVAYWRAMPRDAKIVALPDDLDAVARDLYGHLRALDSADVDTIITISPPPTGVGEAIVDRLTRAAGPRTESKA